MKRMVLNIFVVIFVFCSICIFTACKESNTLSNGSIINQEQNIYDNGSVNNNSIFDTTNASSVSLNKSSLVLELGDTETLTYTILPANATNKAVTWSSNNSSIVTVSNSGFVRAVGMGTTTIKAMTSNGKTATCTVTVKEKEIFEVYNQAITGITDYGATLTEITIPAEVNGVTITSIERKAFEKCTLMKKVVVPDTITDIAIGAFYKCGNLTEMVLPFVGTSIFNNSASELTLFGAIFGGNYYNGSYRVSQYYKDDYSAYVCLPNKLNTITITGGELFYGAFSNFSSLTSVIIDGGVTSIGGCAFKSCTSLTSVAIGNNVTSIRDYAFYKCSDLRTVTIGNSVSNIGEGAFEDCSNLASITIPNSVTSISDYAFSGCSSLICNQYDNALYLGNDTNQYLVLVRSQSTDITTCIIHNDTRFIMNRAFYCCHGLTSVTIGDSVKNIGSYVFGFCDSLTSIVIPDSVTSMGEYAFYCCYGLTRITIGDSVKDIGGHAFSNCKRLENITIPDRVACIINSMFANCNALKDVYFNGTKAQWKAKFKSDGYASDYDTYPICVIYCSDGSLRQQFRFK